MATHTPQKSAYVPIGQDITHTPQIADVVAVDSTNTLYPRIQGFAQRGGATPETTGDLTGKLYADGTLAAKAITLVSVEYASSVGGVYTAVTVLDGDGAYNWPPTGSDSGTAFTVPVTVTETVWNFLWFKITVSYP